MIWSWEFLPRVVVKEKLLKSPLAAIRLHAQTLETDVTDAERGESVEYILRESERLGRLIDNVLESSRLVARKQILDLQPIELRGFLDSYFTELGPRVRKQGVELEVETRLVGFEDAPW